MKLQWSATLLSLALLPCTALALQSGKTRDAAAYDQVGGEARAPFDGSPYNGPKKK
jgi:hypothetical protein